MYRVTGRSAAKRDEPNIVLVLHTEEGFVHVDGAVVCLIARLKSSFIDVLCCYCKGRMPE